MHGILNGIPIGAVEKFFSNIIAFDASLPHTTERFSPITFQTFMSRQGIICLNLLDIYKEANKFWKSYQAITPGILERVQSDKFNLSRVEEKHYGWSPLIDLLSRVVDVRKFDAHPYYQMHYMAHVCYIASDLLSKIDEKDRAYYMAIFNDCISPILYEQFVPNSFGGFAPIMNYTDIRFNESITITCAKAAAFIESHCGNGFDSKEFDKSRLVVLKDLVEKMLKDLVNAKNTESRPTAFASGLVSCGILNADYNSCEFKQIMEANRLCCCKPFKWLNKIRARNEKGLYNGDLDTAIDDLLDVYSSIKEGCEHYNIDDKKEAQPCEK